MWRLQRRRLTRRHVRRPLTAYAGWTISASANHTSACKIVFDNIIGHRILHINSVCRLSTLMSTPPYVDFHIKIISANTVPALDSRKQLTRQCYRQDVYDLPLG